MPKHYQCMMCGRTYTKTARGVITHTSEPIGNIEHSSQLGPNALGASHGYCSPECQEKQHQQWLAEVRERAAQRRQHEAEHSG